MNYSNLSKIPPQALELEEAILGAIMIDKDAADEVFNILKPEYFYSEINKIVFKAISSLYKEKKQIDILTVRDELVKAKKLSEIGGALYLTKLTGRVASATHAEFHARIIKQKFTQRELIRYSDELSNKCYDDVEDVDDILQFADNFIEKTNEIMHENKTKTLTAIIKETANIIATRIENYQNKKLTGVNTGFNDLNKITNGWQKGKLIIIAARPSVGKSSLIHNNIFKLCEEISLYRLEEEIILISLEIADTDITQKLVLNDTDILADNFEAGNINPKEAEIIKKSFEKIENYNLTIIDDIFEIHEIIIECKLLKKQFAKAGKKIKAIFIDYLQLMKITGLNKTSNKNNEISEITRLLKLFAKEIKCPVILLSQLNREVDKRGAGRSPQLSDLRDSGSIEQDADVVILLHRPGKDNPEEPQNEIELLIKKHRNGKLALIKLTHNESLTKFYDYGESYIQNYNKNIENKNFYEPEKIVEF